MTVREYLIPWDRQPQEAAQPAQGLGLVALLQPGQSNIDLIGGGALSSTSGSTPPVPRANVHGLGLLIDGPQASIYGPSSDLQRNGEASIVWIGTFSSGASGDACIGGLSYTNSNSDPYSSIELKRSGDGYLYLSFATAATYFQCAAMAATDFLGPVVIVGVFRNGYQRITVRTSTFVQTATNNVFGALVFTSNATLAVGDWLNGRDPKANCALIGLAKGAWSDSQIDAVVADPWGQLFEPQVLPVPFAAAAGAVNGTLARTNADDTSSATGTTTIRGTLARTNANDTSAGAGTTTVVGTLARTNANDTLAASGAVGGAVTGSLSRTNANDTAAAAGTTTIRGALARSNANDTAAASGFVGSITGSLAATNRNDTLQAAGSGGTAPPTPLPTLGGPASELRTLRRGEQQLPTTRKAQSDWERLLKEVKPTTVL